jgi:hypothetical protein
METEDSLDESLSSLVSPAVAATVSHDQLMSGKMDHFAVLLFRPVSMTGRQLSPFPPEKRKGDSHL